MAFHLGELITDWQFSLNNFVWFLVWSWCPFGTDKWMKSLALVKVYIRLSEFVFENLILGLNGWIKENLVFLTYFLKLRAKKFRYFEQTVRLIRNYWSEISMVFSKFSTVLLNWWFVITLNIYYWLKPKAYCVVLLSLFRFVIFCFRMLWTSTLDAFFPWGTDYRFPIK